MNHQAPVQDTITVRGAFRLQLEDPDGKIVGDSGWNHNQVPNLGKNKFLVSLLGAVAGSSQLSHVAVGSAGAPASNATSLPDELDHAAGSRKAISASSIAGSSSLACYATFASSSGHNTAAFAISNIGLFGISTTQSGQIFCGAAYTSSSWATNQALNVTYQLNFGTA